MPFETQFQLYAGASMIYGACMLLLGFFFWIIAKTRLQSRLSLITLVTGIVCLAVGFYNFSPGN